MKSLSTLATCNFGNFQFWQLAILATYNLTIFNPNNFQFWQFSILAIFKQNFWIDPRTTRRRRTYRLYGSCDQKYRLMRLPVAARKSKNFCQAFKFFPVHFQYRVMSNSQLKENANFLISKYSNTKIVNGQNCVL